MRRAALAAFITLTVGCAHAPKVTPIVLTPAGPVMNTPNGDVDIINLPAWLDDEVELCADDFPVADRQCMTMREIRALLFTRHKAE